MFTKICIAALSIAAVVAEPPVNNGYLPPVTGPPGYNYPKPNQPISQPPYQPPPPPPQPPRPSYGPPTNRPPPPPPPPSYGPPSTIRPPPPRPPPTYTPAPSYTPGPSYGPPPPPPRPSYGPPTNDIAFRPGQNNVQHDSSPGTSSGDHHDHHHHEPGMPFDFNYAVKDDYYGTDYSHNAVSDGDVVRGEYKVLLPDGRLQIVTYTADWKNGFNADIKYQGEPTYPAPGQTGQNRPTGPSGSGPY